MNTQIVVTAMLALNAIIAAVLGGIILRKGVSRKCNAQVGYGAGLLAFSVVYYMVADDVMWWQIGLLPSALAVMVLRQDKVIDRIIARCDSSIARIENANLVPIQVSSDKG